MSLVRSFGFGEFFFEFGEVFWGDESFWGAVEKLAEIVWFFDGVGEVLFWFFFGFALGVVGVLVYDLQVVAGWPSFEVFALNAVN